MKNNFTPGPWEIKNGGDVFGPLGGDSGDGLAADHNDGWQVAEVDSYVTFVEGELTELGYDVRRANMELITTAGTAATRLADMDIDAVKCIEMLPEIVRLLGDTNKNLEFSRMHFSGEIASMLYDNINAVEEILSTIKAGGEEEWKGR